MINQSCEQLVVAVKLADCKYSCKREGFEIFALGNKGQSPDVGSSYPEIEIEIEIEIEDGWSGRGRKGSRHSPSTTYCVPTSTALTV